MDKEQTAALIPAEESSLGRIVITEAQVDLIKNTVAKGATDDELKLFFFECRRRGVHPLDRFIHFVKRGQDANARVAFQSGIDFMRSQAEASGEYRGQEDIEYGPMKAIIEHDDIQAPEWAKAFVKRRDPETGEIIITSTTAYWSEFYPGETLGFMWRKMPRLMLGKVAEAQALRKAFPRQLQGLYSFEEMEQADIVESPSKPALKPPQAKSTKKAETPAEQTEEKKSIRQVLIEELTTYVNKDIAAFKKVLKEITAFGDNKGTDDVSKLSEKWAGSALGKLRKRIGEENPGIPDDCTKDPGTCEHSSYDSDGNAGCIEGKPCKYYSAANA